MSDTRSRAAKLAAMAAALESPHEAAVAAGKLAAMGTGGTAVVRVCKIPKCGGEHYANGLCNVHYQRARRPAMEMPAEIKCGAETFDGTERKRCTRPASQVRDGLLVCRQHERLEFVSWAGRGNRLRASLPERSVPQLTARRRIPEGWHLFDHDGVAATRVEDLPVTPPFVRSRRPGDPAPSVREVFPA
jgi:hypothetical protein